MKLFIVVTFVPNLFIFINCLQCVDESGNNVDWYVLYKLPHIKKNAPNPLVKHGEAYLFISSSNLTSWTLSDSSVLFPNSFLARTLEPLYDKQKVTSTMHILYNDQPPNKNPNNKRGHSKGVILGDKDGGVWLVHSVPLFPPAASENYDFPQTGFINGQSVLCLSLNPAELNNTGVQLQYNEIEIYSSNMPYELVEYYPKLYDVINHKTDISAPWFHTLPIKTVGGIQFLSFAKTKNFMKDLYEDWVAPALNTNLYVETWQNGPGKLSSNCSTPFSVYNIESVNITSIAVSFTSTLDHSKWAVNNDINKSWICIGDINRAEHQKQRGGGTVCFDNKKIAEAYRNAIATTEPCPKHSKKIFYSLYQNLV